MIVRYTEIEMLDELNAILDILVTRKDTDPSYASPRRMTQQEIMIEYRRAKSIVCHFRKTAELK
jgi:hypothetical protein